MIIQYSNYQDIVYSPTIAFTKLSIMLLILRIFVTRQRTVLFWSLQALMYLNSVFYLIYLIIPIFLCMPRRKIWTPSLPGHCLNPSALYTASAAFNVVSDLGMLIIPSYSIWRLQITTKRKVGILAVFGTGSLYVSTPHPFSPLPFNSSINLSQQRLPLQYFPHRKFSPAAPNPRPNILSSPRLILDVSSPHPFYSPSLLIPRVIQLQANHLLLDSHAEITCGILCSCLPILPRLIRHLFMTPCPPKGSASPSSSKASTNSTGMTVVESTKRVYSDGPKVSNEPEDRPLRENTT